MVSVGLLDLVVLIAAVDDIVLVNQPVGNGMALDIVVLNRAQLP